MLNVELETKKGEKICEVLAYDEDLVICRIVGSASGTFEIFVPAVG